MTDWEVVIIGRKGLYEEWLTEDGITTIQGWARDGLTNIQIAKNIGVSERTFADWIARFPAFSAALKKGKAPVDFEVENALLKRALGYDYKEVITEIEEAPGGKQKKHIRKVQKHMPGDTTAQIFWLKNRRPKRWRDRVETVPEVQNDLLQSLMDLERRLIHD